MSENVLLVRFNDHPSDSVVRPLDEVGSLAELVATGGGYPAIVEAALGLGRQFVSAYGDGFAAQDVDSGSTLLTRNTTIQVVLFWDAEGAGIYGSPGTIYARGKGTSSAEYLGAGLELRTIDADNRIGEVRWIWQDLSGNLKTQIGGHFQAPEDGYLMITATRRWVSNSSVMLRYYLGDAPLAAVESADGEIGGGTTGTTSIGTRYDAGAVAWGNHFDGIIDEIRVVDDELTEEEIRATWQRITVEQPRGYRLLQEVHDPGFPISTDPASRAQRETRQWGHGLGFAAAQAENVRQNILPDRSYGEILSRWEAITKQSPKAGDDAFTRRRRVVGKIRQRLGASPPGVRAALLGLLDTVEDNLDVIAFDNTITETWETLNETRWRHDPSAQWTLAPDALRVQSSTDRIEWSDWCTSLMSVGGNGRAAAMLAYLDPATIQTQGEAGFVFIDRASRNAFLFGLRNDAGTYRLVTEELGGGVLGGATNRAAPGLVPLWLRMYHDDNTGEMRIAWSDTSADGPFTEVAGIATGLTSFQWAGFYARTFSSATPAIDVSFDDTTIRAPYADRTRRFYILRDPADPGNPDYLGANAVIRGLRQAHTIGYAVRTIEALYDDDSTGYDLEPMGGV